MWYDQIRSRCSCSWRIFHYISLLFYTPRYAEIWFVPCCCHRWWYSFKGAFITICEALYLNNDGLAKRNSKGLTVENFHRFLNKSSTIVNVEHGTISIFVSVGVAADYVWNSAPIDGTDVLRNILAIPVNNFTTLLPSVSIIFSNRSKKNGQAVLYYLKLNDSSRNFSTSILKSLSRIVALLIQSALTIIDILLF